MINGYVQTTHVSSFEKTRDGRRKHQFNLLQNMLMCVSHIHAQQYITYISAKNSFSFSFRNYEK